MNEVGSRIKAMFKAIHNSDGDIKMYAGHNEKTGEPALCVVVDDAQHVVTRSETEYLIGVMDGIIRQLDLPMSDSFYQLRDNFQDALKIMRTQ